MGNGYFIKQWALVTVLFLLALLPDRAGANPLYLDDSSECISTSLAEKYIRDFNIDFLSFGAKDFCHPDSEIKKLVGDIFILEAGHFLSSHPHNLIPGFIKQDSYYDWLKSQTVEILRLEGRSEAAAFNSNGRYVLQSSWARQSTIDRIGTLIHEARHSTGYPHSRCTRGPYADTPHYACDESFVKGGSHAVEIEYYARVALRGVNFHPVYKSMARLMAMARGNFVFNQPVLTPRDGLIIQTESGHFWILDDQKWIFRPPLRVGNRLVTGTLKRTSFGASLFDGHRAFALDMYTNSEIPASLDLYSYFKLIKEFSLSVRDFEEFDIQNKRIAVAISHDNRFSTFNFSRGEWRPFMDLNFAPIFSSTLAPDGSSGYFLVDSPGKIIAFDAGTFRFSDTPMTWNPDFVSMTKVNGDIYALTKQKKILKLEKQKWTEISLPPGVMINQMATTPLYKEMDLKE